MTKNLFSKITTLAGAGIFFVFSSFAPFADSDSKERLEDNLRMLCTNPSYKKDPSSLTRKISRIFYYVQRNGTSDNGLSYLEIPIKNGNCTVFAGEHPWAEGVNSIQILYEKEEFNYKYNIEIFDQNANGIKEFLDSFEYKINDWGPYESITSLGENEIDFSESLSNYSVAYSQDHTSSGSIYSGEEGEKALSVANAEYDIICDGILDSIYH